jgi:hypothetical protein
MKSILILLPGQSNTGYAIGPLDGTFVKLPLSPLLATVEYVHDFESWVVDCLVI